jgi:hypothetical protein
MTTYRVGVAYRGTTTYDIDAPDEDTARCFYWDMIRNSDRLRPGLCEIVEVTIKETP